MIVQVILSYLIPGLIVAIRTGWTGGVEVAVAKAQHGERAAGARVSALNCIHDMLIWPAMLAAFIAEAKTAREIAEAPPVPPAQLQLRRPTTPTGGTAA